jgi:hypothetical protein
LSGRRREASSVDSYAEARRVAQNANTRFEQRSGLYSA